VGVEAEIARPGKGLDRAPDERWPVDAAAASLRLQPDLSWRRAAASVAQRQIAGMVNVSGGKMTLVEALAAWMNWPSVYPHCTPGVDLTGRAKSPKNAF
jgi:hypothetical protein